MKKITLLFVFLTLCFSSQILIAQVNWDFEDENDHGFTLRSIIQATPADADDDIAGDEEITGIGGDDGLPGAGIAWTIGPPNQFDELIPAFAEGCHDDGADGYLLYSSCNDPFGFVASPENSRGQYSYLNTYNLSQWGDNLHTQENDQIATSPPVLLDSDAMLTVWSLGGGSKTFAPELDSDSDSGYVSGSSGIAVLDAEDGSLLASMLTQNKNSLLENTLDLSDFAGLTVIIEVVDAFAGGWGWLAIDEIEITNATEVTSSGTGINNKQITKSKTLQNYPNPFNKNTTIEYTLSNNTQTEIVVYDIIGHKVATLVDEYKKPGIYNVTWDASGFDAGVYIYQLKTNMTIESKKMNLVK